MENIENALILGTIGDIIGFGNGSTEFNDNSSFNSTNYVDYLEDGSEQSNHIFFSFIYEGGYSMHPKPTWHISDDTMMTLSNAKAIIRWKQKGLTDTESLIMLMKEEYISLIDSDLKLNNFINKYYAGVTTIANIKRLKNGVDYKTFKYDNNAGGSGTTMRTGIIGALITDEQQLIEICIESALLTHPNAIAFLGSVAIGLFASYAIKKIKMELWCIKMIEIIESDIIDNYIRENKSDMFVPYMKDKKKFINKWRDYIEDNFTEMTYKYIKRDIRKYPSKRSLYYNNFSARENEIYPGAGGDDSVIISFDILMDSEGSWENIVMYSMLHVGDSDTTGCICAFLYGLVYGENDMTNIMKNNTIGLNNVENIIKEIKKIL